MEISPLSDRSVAEEDEQAFLAPSSRRKKRSLTAKRAALRPWAIGIGLTVLVAVAAVGTYTLAASIGSWNDRPSAAATPTAHPVPMPSASSEAAMSGGYAIGPDGVLVRPAEFAADTYTKPELPEEAKENTERSAEAAAEHYLALLVYAWNTGDTQPFMDMSDPSSEFAKSYAHDIEASYQNGWIYGTESTVVHVLRIEPVTEGHGNVQANTIGVKLQIISIEGVTCQGQKITTNNNEYTSTLSLFMTWKNGRWIETQGRVISENEQ